MIMRGVKRLKLSKLRLYWKLAMLSFGLILFSVLIGIIILLGNVTRLKEEEISSRVMITARTAANLPDVKNNMQRKDGWKQIAPVADELRIINGVNYVVVLDMARIRLSHPIWSRIGSTFDGEEADAAFAEHTYLSKARGEAGTAVRAFVPVMNERHEQIGVAIAGQLLPGLQERLWDQRESIGITLLLSLLFGFWGSWLLARHMKRQMFNLEPQEIARMFWERDAAFQAMHEGVIAIDTQGNITIMNEQAKRIFGLSGEVIGQPIDTVITDTRLPEVMRSGVAQLNQEQTIGNAIIWSNRIPIREGGKIVGAVTIFQDRTEFAKVAEELTGVRAFVDALRVQSHEYHNKMHTVAGLLQMGKTKQALEYLLDVSETYEEMARFLQQNISDDSLAGLLLAKIGRGKELGIRVELDRRSQLTTFPPALDRHDFVSLLGNLIENAFEALACSTNEPKEVYISMEQDDDFLSLLVEDNGIGMSKETMERMKERGFSTKSGQGRGQGLFFIAAIVEKGHGRLECRSAVGEGTSFLITFPMEGGKGREERAGY